MNIFMKPTDILKIQEELKEYRRLCVNYGYVPDRNEFDEIIKFLLLNQGGQGGAMMESVVSDWKTIDPGVDYLYKNLNKEINEEIEAGGSQFFDSAMDTVRSSSNIAVGLVAGTALVAGLWIAYMFKKSKVKSSIKNELSVAMDILDDYSTIYKKKLELAKLEGRDLPKASMPEYPQ